MATTLSTSFRNDTVNSITGKASVTAVLYYFGFFNGAQPADPSATPAGSPVYSGYSVGPTLAGVMPAATQGVSAMSVSRSASATSAVTGVAFGRVYNSSGTGMVDTPASVLGGGGGVILPTLNSQAGVAFQVDGFSMKMPFASGTVSINAALANAIVNAWCSAAVNIGLGTSAAVNVYSGAAPSSADAAATGTLLATFTTAAAGASWSTAAAGLASLVSALSVAATATGTAGYVRIVKGTYVLQGSVGTTGTDFILSTLSLTSGVSVSMTDASIAM